MNSLNKLFCKSNWRAFVKIPIRNKFKRLTQPGLTRYGWDELDIPRNEVTNKIT